MPPGSAWARGRTIGTWLIWRRIEGRGCSSVGAASGGSRRTWSPPSCGLTPRREGRRFSSATARSSTPPAGRSCSRSPTSSPSPRTFRVAAAGPGASQSGRPSPSPIFARRRPSRRPAFSRVASAAIRTSGSPTSSSSSPVRLSQEPLSHRLLHLHDDPGAQLVAQPTDPYEPPLRAATQSSPSRSGVDAPASNRTGPTPTTRVTVSLCTRT